jgi:hypothetical protein
LWEYGKGPRDDTAANGRVEIHGVDLVENGAGKTGIFDLLDSIPIDVPNSCLRNVS